MRFTEFVAAQINSFRASDGFQQAHLPEHRLFITSVLHLIHAIADESINLFELRNALYYPDETPAQAERVLSGSFRHIFADSQTELLSMRRIWVELNRARIEERIQWRESEVGSLESVNILLETNGYRPIRHSIAFLDPGHLKSRTEKFGVQGFWIAQYLEDRGLTVP